MKRSRKSAKGVDIHSPQMVKTIFISASLAILAFLIMVVKYTSFSSEPKAGFTNKQTAKARALLRLTCRTQFTEEYLKGKLGFTSTQIKDMVSDINTASIDSNTVTKEIKSRIINGTPTCDFNYTNIGEAGISPRYVCCVKNEYINQLTLKKMGLSKGAVSANAGGGALFKTAPTPVPEGTTAGNCGSSHVNCAGKYGTYLNNTSNTLSYTVMCVKDKTKPVGSGYRCAINVGSEGSCNGINSTVIPGSSADVLNTDNTVAYKVCWLY